MTTVTQGYVKDTYCSYCGNAFGEGLAWPRSCSLCGNTTYRNPLPVSVVLLPILGGDGEGGLLLVRRRNAPGVGELALPGGYVEVGESWQEAGARELWEETGVRTAAADIRLFDARSAPDGTLLVFGLALPRTADSLPAFAPTKETSETVIARGPAPLAFSTHSEVTRRFWEERPS